MLERFDTIRNGLADAARLSGRDASSVSLVAVSKWHDAKKVAELARYWKGLGVGYPVFGENYVQEAVDKQTAVASLLCASTETKNILPEWHFIGHVQSRKARDVVGRFNLIHTLDSEKLANQLQKMAQSHNLPPQEVLIQVNIGEEPQKSGVAPDATEALITSVMQLSEIHITGLMCLPPLFGEAEVSRPYFVKLRELRDTLARATGLALPHLSMGMTGDFEIAVEEGATMVRIGTALFR